MKTLPVKKYNQQQTVKWRKDWDTAKQEGRDWGCMPQLAFYVFEKSYGYVTFKKNTACWAKTKKESIKLFESCNYTKQSKQ